MNTAGRAEALALAAAHFPELYPPTARDLVECVRLELGHEEILDGFQPYGGHLSMAVAPRTILHILSGNTPHAAFQTLLRGLLLGSHNLVKFPSCGLGEMERFAEWLPPGLASKMECSRQLTENWVDRADAWVVFGNDETVAELRKKCPVEVPFQPHGHRISLGLVLDDHEGRSCAGAARDICLFEQQGCLSSQVIFVEGDALRYGEALTHEMAKYEAAHPVPSLTLESRAGIANARAEWEFRASVDPSVKVWKSAGEPGWTMVLDGSAEFPVSPGNRFIFIKPLTVFFDEWIARHSRHLGGLGIWPCTPGNALRFSSAGFSRICAIGRMQEAPFTWHGDSKQNLASLVRWVDFEA
ncbi:MAG: acyl-CoA reductase [Terrimicrobiaceae bacterium]